MSRVKVKIKLLHTHRGVEVYLHAFLTSTLGGGEWLASRPGRFNPKERTSVLTEYEAK
jgi:hypothetical protein